MTVPTEDYVTDTVPAAPPAPEAVPPTDIPENPPQPLFFAVVDDVDHTAVTALIAVIPINEGTDFVVYERRDGVWIEAPQYKSAIQSVDPPALVELSVDELVDVTGQIDASDAANPG